MARIRKITLNGREYVEHTSFVRYHLATNENRRGVTVIIQIGKPPTTKRRTATPAQTLVLNLRSVSHLHNLLRTLKQPGGNWKKATCLFLQGELAGILALDQQVLWLNANEYQVIPNGN